MRHSASRWCIALGIAGMAHAASAQTPLRMHVDIAAATPAFDSSGTKIAGDNTGITGIATGCSSAPVTSDAAVWSVVVYSSVAPEGAIELTQGALAYINPAQPNHIFVPLITGTGLGDITIRVRDHEFHGAATIKPDLMTIGFGPMTLAEASDVGDWMSTSRNILNAELAKRNVTVRTFDIALTAQDAVAPSQWNRDTAAIQYVSKVIPALGIDRAAFADNLDKLASGMSITLEAPLGAIDATEADSLKEAIRTLRHVKQGGTGFYLIDEPCLQFAISPFVSPSSGSSGTTAAATAFSFRGRYDFYSAAGRGFLKFRGEGDGAPSGTYYDRLEGTADFGMNTPLGGSVVSLGGSGSYAVKRDGTARIDTLRGTAKAKWQGPNLAGIFGSLSGGGTSPLASGEFGFITGNGALNQPTDWIARFDFSLTGRFTQRLSIDLKADGAVAGTPRFAGLDRFAYRAVQFRFNVNKDWDYLIKYECGRKDPDYKEFCGSQSGLAMTVGR